MFKIIDSEGKAVKIASTVDLDGEHSIEALGTPSDPPWDGTSPNATVISLLKAIALSTTPSP